MSQLTMNHDSKHGHRNARDLDTGLSSDELGVLDSSGFPQ